MGYRETKPEGNYFLFFCVCFLRLGLTMPAWNSLFRGSDMVTPPPPPWVSMSIGLLILPLFISSLCSHFYERLLHSRFPGPLALTIFSLSLPQHFLRSCDINVSTVAGLPAICPSMCLRFLTQNCISSWRHVLLMLIIVYILFGSFM